MSKYRFRMKSTVWELIPAGDYVLKLIAVEDGPVFTNDKTGEDEPTTKLKLEVEQGPSQGLGMSALLNPANSGPKSNARRWAQALLGHELADDEEFDPADFVDTLVWARVTVKPDGKGVDRNGIDWVVSYAALEAQFTKGGGNAGAKARSGAAPRPAPPTRGSRLGAGLEASPDRELQLPETPGDDPGWHAMQPPPVEEGSER